VSATSCENASCKKAPIITIVFLRNLQMQYGQVQQQRAFYPIARCKKKSKPRSITCPIVENHMLKKGQYRYSLTISLPLILFIEADARTTAHSEL